MRHCISREFSTIELVVEYSELWCPLLRSVMTSVCSGAS